MKNNKNSSPWKSAKVGLYTLLALVIFAYGFQITKVDLEELRSENRQQSLVRVLRALAQPEIFEYDQVEEVVNYPIHVPCLSDGNQVSAPERGANDPYIVITPSCANPGEIVQVEGFNFAPLTVGPVRFVPGNDPNNIVSLGRENAETDADGHFIVEMEIPDRTSDDEQFIRATLRRNVGLPHFSKTAYDT